MKSSTLFVVLTVAAVWVFGFSPQGQNRLLSAAAGDIPASSKVQPDNPSLGSNVSGKERGEVPFTHKAHSTEAKYSVEGKTAVSCAECHHTDQPDASKCGVSAKGFTYKTFERQVCLTAAELSKTDSQPVKSCNSCHFPESNVPAGKTLPVGGPKSIDLNSKEAYHLNCVECHRQARKARGEGASNAPLLSRCSGCHK